MSKLGQAKVLGGIGALLSLLVVVPSIGFIIGLVGLILVFIAVKYIAEETKDHAIFHNYLMNFIFDIIAIGAVIGIMIMAFGVSGGMSWANALQGKDFTDFDSFWSSFGTLFVGCALALVVAWVMLLIGALYLRKSYNSIAEHTKVDLFKTTGLVNFIGAATLIIVIGFFIIIVARILEIVSYFSLPENLPAPTEPPKPQTP
ncbi:MAG TPA: DUF996 domain-containing protein [Thermoplasmata archaeon]|jgi:uncharacterized membrane protein|nr:DUF996 domain-containing protein [Thermoplasmata archaeon]